MDNSKLNNNPRRKVKVLGAGHIIGYSTDGAVFESKISPFNHFVAKDNRVNRPITCFCFILN